MNAIVLHAKMGICEIPITDLSRRLPKEGFCWVDIGGAPADELGAVVDALAIDEDTGAWLPRFGQRARFEFQNKRLRVSTWALNEANQLCEVHLLYSPPAWLLTVHSGATAAMDRSRGILKILVERESFNPQGTIFIVLHELLAGFDPLVEHCDEWLDKLETEIMQSPRGTLLEELSRLRLQLMSLHRVLIPHRDEIRDFGVATAGMLPDDSSHQLHEYGDRVSGLVDDIDDLRQRVTDAMQSYSASVSNLQAGVINRLTIISAVFLPLTFLTGFFGMNFQWMIDRIDSLQAFLWLGMGLFAGILALVLVLFWRLGWLGVKRSAMGHAGAGPSAGNGILDRRSGLKPASSATAKPDPPGPPTMNAPASPTPSGK